MTSCTFLDSDWLSMFRSFVAVLYNKMFIVMVCVDVSMDHTSLTDEDELKVSTDERKQTHIFIIKCSREVNLMIHHMNVCSCVVTSCFYTPEAELQGLCDGKMEKVGFS